MLKLASQLKSLPILSLRDGEKLALVEDLVVDPDTGKFLAVTLKKESFFGKQKIISPKDFREVTAEMIIVDSEDVLTEPEEIIRVNELFSQKFGLEGRSVKTEGGSQLGNIRDFAIELNTSALLRLYVRSKIIGKELLVSWGDIIRIEPKQVIVKDLNIPEPEESIPLPKVIPTAAPPVTNAIRTP